MCDRARQDGIPGGRRPDGADEPVGENEQKAKNLGRNPKCILTAGTTTLTGDDYVIEGTASLVSDPERLETIATAFEQSYGWHLTLQDGTWYGMSDQMRSGATNTYVVNPSIIFAFGNGEPFSETRYHFD